MAALSMKDLEAAVEAGAAAASKKPEGIVLQQSDGSEGTRWSFEDETPETQDERPINDDVAVKTCAGSIGVGLFARRKLEGAETRTSMTKRSGLQGPAAHGSKTL